MKKHIHYEQFDPRVIETYELFKRKEGSEHIATPVTLQALLDLQPRHVLELGAGIGTITYTLLRYCGASIDTYEDNAFCKNALKENCSGFEYTLISDYSIAPSRMDYDAVVVDGGSGRPHDGGRVDVAGRIFGGLNSIGIVYIEGQRNIQRTLVRKVLARKYIYRLVEYKGLRNAPYKSGLAIVCTPSTNTLRRWFNYYYWELIEWTGIKNALLYRIKSVFNHVRH